METIQTCIEVDETLGTVSGEFVVPANARCIMTIAHGAGAGMQHSFMKKLAHALGEQEICSLRFNLHYMEHKKRRPDSAPIAHKVICAALNHASRAYPGLPLIASGKSFGGRMTSQLLSQSSSPDVRGIVFYGFPLHPAGKPGIDRADHLKHVHVPMLFLQGSRDALARVELITDVVNDLSTANLDIIENADHSFKVGTKDCIDLLSKKTKNWLVDKRIV